MITSDIFPCELFNDETIYWNIKEEFILLINE